MEYAGYVVMGLAAGFLSACLGVGGGIVIVPMLLIFFGLENDPKLAIGTSLAYIVPVSLAGAFQHGLRGNVEWKIVLLAFPFGILGTYLGVKANDAMKGNTLKILFGIVMMLVGAKMVFLPGGWNDIMGKFRRAPAAVQTSAPSVREPEEKAGGDHA